MASTSLDHAISALTCPLAMAYPTEMILLAAAELKILLVPYPQRLDPNLSWTVRFSTTGPAPHAFLATCIKSGISWQVWMNKLGRGSQDVVLDIAPEYLRIQYADGFRTTVWTDRKHQPNSLLDTDDLMSSRPSSPASSVASLSETVYLSASPPETAISSPAGSPFAKTATLPMEYLAIA